MKIADLKGREGEVTRLIIRGYKAPEIEQMLGISRSSVHTYRYSAFERLGIKTDAQLIALALREVLEDGRGRHRIIDEALSVIGELLP